MKINNYLHKIVLFATLVLPCLSDRFYLLNFNSTSNCNSTTQCITTTTQPPQVSPFRVDCKYSANACATQKGGWKCEKNQWRFHETTLSRRCCCLKIKLDIPSNMPSPKKIYIDMVYTLYQCRVYGSQKCRENLPIEGDVEEDIEFFEADKNMKKSWNRSIIPDKKQKTIEIKFCPNNFNGALNAIQIYFEYCPSGSHQLAEYPNMTIDSIENGTCISNAVVSSALKPVRKCDLNGQTGRTVGGCACKRGFTLMSKSNPLQCKGRYSGTSAYKVDTIGWKKIFLSVFIEMSTLRLFLLEFS